MKRKIFICVTFYPKAGSSRYISSYFVTVVSGICGDADIVSGIILPSGPTTLGRTKRSIHGALAIINVVIMHLRG
jgi:hypothetical protein